MSVPGKVTLSVLDQAVLSGLNFIIGGAFVAASPKEEYGSYVLIFGFLLLLAGIQNALISTPLTANGSKLSGAERDRYIDAMFRLQMIACALAAVGLGLIVAFWPGGDRGGRIALGAATVVAVLGSWMREFRRTEGFLRQSPRSVLHGDLRYVALCCVALGAEMVLQKRLSAAFVLTFVGLAGIVTGVRRFGGAGSALADPSLGQLWPQVRWTIPNVVVTWMQGNSFPYFVAMFAGARGVADLSAARLFIMPISLLSVGWARVFQPQAGERLAASDPESVFSMARSGAAKLFLLGLAYGVLLFGLGSLGGWRLLPDRYAGIVGPMVLWWIYFLISGVRSVATVGLIAHLVFKQLFSFSVLTALVSVPLMIATGQWLGYEFVIAGMALGEALLALLLWRELTRVSAPIGVERASLGFA